MMIRRFFRFSFPDLYTPGPVKTTERTKNALLIDYGSRDQTFTKMVEEIKSRLLRIAKASEDEYATVIVQGPGTFGIEGALGAIRRDGSEKILVARNGHYGMNIEKIAKALKLPIKVLEKPENEPINPSDVVNALEDDITHFAIVHSETPTGMLNPLNGICQSINKNKPDIIKIVDGISAFGMDPIDLREARIHYYVSSFNKFLQGFPGAGFVLAQIEHLQKTKGLSHSLSLDLHDQWDYQLKNKGQFRFTPPTHIIAALHEALIETDENGGQMLKFDSIKENQEVFNDYMLQFGFKSFLSLENQAVCVNAYHQPKHLNWDFKHFQVSLSRKNVWIYQTSVTKSTPTFRVSLMGDHTRESTIACAKAIHDTLQEMRISLPLK